MDIKDWKILRDKKVVEKYKAGKPVKKIVEELAISPELVVAILKDKNVKKNEQKDNKKDNKRNRKEGSNS